MNVLLTEFTAINYFALDQAYVRACRAVEQVRSISVVDVRDSSDHSGQDVDLAIYAARFSDIRRRPCARDVKNLALRQGENVSLTLAIAAVGPPDENGLVKLGAIIGHSPIGASRWIVSVADAQELYEEIVAWILYLLDRRSSSGTVTQSLGEDSVESIELAERNPSDIGRRPVIFRGVP